MATNATHALSSAAVPCVYATLTTKCIQHTVAHARVRGTIVAHARPVLPGGCAVSGPAGDELLCEPDASRDAAVRLLRAGLRGIWCGDEAVGGVS